MEIKRLIVGPLETNCYLIKAGNETAIIDPGSDTSHILAELKNLGGEVKYIIATHYHDDHVRVIQSIKQETKAQVLIHEKEKPYLEFAVDRFLKDGEDISLGTEKLNVINSPGHTPGSICLIGDGFIFTGDTIFADGFGRTDMPGGSQADMILSLQKLAEIILPGTKVYPGHGQIYTA
jgi:hydroxyacylglutathione hydrolase